MREGLRLDASRRAGLAVLVAALVVAGCASVGRVALDVPRAREVARSAVARDDVRIVSLNCAMLPWPLAPRNVERAGRIADALLARPLPDVVVLVEVFDEAARRVFAERLRATHPWIASRGGDGNPLREDSGLFLASRLPMVGGAAPRVEFAPFREAGPISRADRLAAKGVLGAELDLGADESLCVLATHLMADHEILGQYASVRARQVREVKAFADGFVAAVAPGRRRSAILVGDLNVRAEEPAPGAEPAALRPTAEYAGLLALLGGPRDLFRAARPFDAGLTWNLDPRGPGADPTQPAQRLDYALALPVAGAADDPASGPIDAETLALDPGLSDHRALAVAVPVRPATPVALSALAAIP